MEAVYDVVILGRGPAGLAAAIGARSRNQSVLVIGNPEGENPLVRSPLVDNYPGLPGLTGTELLSRMSNHAQAMGAEFLTGRALSIVSWGETYAITVGNNYLQGRNLILCTGVSRGIKYPGEERLLGRGVSYCATCDGMLYRGKAVVVVGLAADSGAEANYLQSIGCQVTFVGRSRPAELKEEIPFLSLRPLTILGEDRVASLICGEAELPCEGVFLLRNTVSPTDLLDGLVTTGDGYIQVNHRQETNLPHVYAAGDCTGGLLQVAKAVGEGLSAGEYASGA